MGFKTIQTNNLTISKKALQIVEHCHLGFMQHAPIISIAPMVSYLLSKYNIKYKIMTPAHDIDNDNQEKYLNLQVNWIETLDLQFSKYLHPFPGEIRHYWLYQVHLLKSGMDILPIRAWQFNNIIREEKPTYVYLYTYLNRPKTPKHSINFIGESSASELVLSEASKHYGFNLEIIKSCVIEDNIQDTQQFIKANHNNLINYLYKLKERISGLTAYLIKNDHPLNLLALQNNYDMPDILSRIRSKGHKTYIFNNQSLYQYNAPFNGIKVYTINDDEFNSELNKQKNILESVIDEFDKKQWYLQWYDDFCGLPLSKYLIPGLREFAIDGLSNILAYKIFCKRILNDFRIDYLITSSIYRHSDFGFVLASKELKKTKSVMITHGNTWFQTRLDDYCDPYPFDIYFASDYELANYFKERTKELKLKTEIYEGTGRFQKYTLKHLGRLVYGKYIYKKKLSKLFSNSNAPTVVYVPTIFMGDRRIINYPYYNDPWYFELQKAIITTFNKHLEFNFIVKIMKGIDSVLNPIHHMINDLHSVNVLLRDDPFYCWLYNANLFILDSPSTALYEVMAVEKPFYILLHDEIPIRKSISKYFNNKLRQHVGIFHEIQEIESLITNFLNTYNNINKISYESSKIDNIVSTLENRILS